MTRFTSTKNTLAMIFAGVAISALLLTTSLFSGMGTAVWQAGSANESMPIQNAVAASSANQGYVSSSSPHPLAATIAPPKASLKTAFTSQDAEFVQAGVGLRNVGSGTISVHVPVGAKLVQAFLYWSVIDNSPPSSIAAFNGAPVVGTLIASGASPCWGLTNIYVYKATVTNNLILRGGPIDDQTVIIPSNNTDSKSPWDFDVSNGAPMAEGAHLIIVYKDPSNPVTSDVRIYEASGSPGTITFYGGQATFKATFANPHAAGTPASVGFALADGQIAGNPQPNTKSFKWASGTMNATMSAGEIYGRDPSITSKSTIRGSLSDTPQFDISANTPDGATSGTLTWDFANDCLSTIAVAVQA